MFQNGCAAGIPAKLLTKCTSEHEDSSSAFSQVLLNKELAHARYIWTCFYFFAVVRELQLGWDQECSAVARYDIVLNLPMSDTGAY